MTSGVDRPAATSAGSRGQYDGDARSGQALTPATDDDLSLWERACAALTDGWLPANAEKVRAVEALGRDMGGALWLRAPPAASAVLSAQQVRAALVHAGDATGAHAQLVTG